VIDCNTVFSRLIFFDLFRKLIKWSLNLGQES